MGVSANMDQETAQSIASADMQEGKWSLNSAIRSVLVFAQPILRKKPLLMAVVMLEELLLSTFPGPRRDIEIRMRRHSSTRAYEWQTANYGVIRNIHILGYHGKLTEW